MLIRKSCGNCGRQVSLSSHAGQRCPHCGARWGTERQYEATEARTSSTSDVRPEVSGRVALISLTMLVLAGLALALWWSLPLQLTLVSRVALTVVCVLAGGMLGGAIKATLAGGYRSEAQQKELVSGAVVIMIIALCCVGIWDTFCHLTTWPKIGLTAVGLWLAGITACLFEWAMK